LLFDLSKKIDTKFFNTHFWEQVISAGNRNKFNNQKKLYFSKLGDNNLHSELKNAIIQKTKQLQIVQFPTNISLEIA
jgi:hypothetical protein